MVGVVYRRHSIRRVTVCPDGIRILLRHDGAAYQNICISFLAQGLDRIFHGGYHRCRRLRARRGGSRRLRESIIQRIETQKVTAINFYNITYAVLQQEK